MRLRKDMPERHFGVKRVAVAAVLVFAAFVYLNNTSFLAEPIGEGPVLLAHRGLAQSFSREGLTSETCTAAQMLPTPHDYLENGTRPSAGRAMYPLCASAAC